MRLNWTPLIGQRSAGWGIDKRLEVQLRNKADKFVAQEDVEEVDQVATQLVERFNFSDTGRFSLIRDDIYRRFIVLEDGTESDDFGRKGRWIPRGCRIFFFYDLTYHNAILRGDEISLIDLESVLPLSGYGKDMTFSMRMIQQIDIGYPVQREFHSPSWYAKYIEELIAVPSDAGDKNLH